MLFALALCLAFAGHAQMAPSAAEQASCIGLHVAAAQGDTARVRALLAAGALPDAADARRRTALHVAAHAGHHDGMRALVAGGPNPNAIEGDRYDILTIAAVADDVPTLDVALALGGSAKNLTSRYDGTALIAAAHLGHVEAVRVLIAAGAPLDHVNNMGWTALIESIVLGDGGARHTETLQRLLGAGANPNLADRSAKTPLALARSRGHAGMVRLLVRTGAR